MRSDSYNNFIFSVYSLTLKFNLNEIQLGKDKSWAVSDSSPESDENGANRLYRECNYIKIRQFWVESTKVIFPWGTFYDIL